MTGLPGVPEPEPVAPRAKPRRAARKLRVGDRVLLDAGPGGRPFASVAEMLGGDRVMVALELPPHPTLIVNVDRLRW